MFWINKILKNDVERLLVEVYGQEANLRAGLINKKGLDEKIRDIRIMYSDMNETVRDHDIVIYGENNKSGLLGDVKVLIEENRRLKAIVAELCDYVYRENK